MNVYLCDLVDALDERGVRVQGSFEDNLHFNKVKWLATVSDLEAETLYVRARLLPDGSVGTALILQYELLLLDEYGPEQAYEMIMDIMARYNNWEARMISTVLSGKRILDFLTVAAEQFDCPLLLTDARLDLVEIYGIEEAEIEQVRVFLKISPFLGPLEKAISSNLTDFRASLPEVENHILCSALWHGRQYLGRLYLYHFLRPIHEGVVYRIQEVTKLMGCLLAVNADQYFSISYISSVLPDAVHGRFDQWDKLRLELYAVGWVKTHSLLMIAIGECDDPDLLSELHEVIRSRALPCYLFHEAPRLILLGNEDLQPMFGMHLRNMIRRLNMSLSVGVSGAFLQISKIPVYYQQAVFALKLAVSSGAALSEATGAAELAYREILSRNERLRDWSHPALRRLTEYDSRQDTQLFETLSRFLMNGCCYNSTAGELGIHPNSVRYRIRKADELMGGNIYDPIYRESLIFSLLVM